MKKKLVVYLAGLLTVVSMGFGSAQFSDVPAGHWAKEAVEQIAACGLIQGFPDGTYRGRENLTRYQAALIFQRLLNELKEGGKCVAPPAQPAQAPVDLSAIEARIKAIEDAQANMQPTDTSDLEARIAALEDAMGAMEPTDTSDLEARIAALEGQAGAPAPTADTADLEARIAALEDAQAAALPPETVDTSDLQARIAALEDALAAIQGQPAPEIPPAAAPFDSSVLEARVATLEGALADVDNRLSDVDGRTNDLGARVSILEDVIAAMDEKMSATPEAAPAGMSEEDMNVLRNAMQELAAELAALGVRTSALEDNAASKDDISRLEAAIEELKAAPAPEAGVSEAAFADLADRVEAASVAADTALAQAQILAERLDGIEADVATVRTQLEADADSIRALNELAVLLNQDVLSLQDRVTAVEKATADLANVNFDEFASKEDVSAVQEFATALRGDLVKLSDKVAGLESSIAALQNAPQFSMAGNVTARYGYSRMSTDDIDTGRMVPNTLSKNFLSSFWDGYTFDTNDNGQTIDHADFTNSNTGNTRARVIANFTVKRPTPATGPGFNLQEATFGLRVTQEGADRFPAANLGGWRVQSATVRGNIDAQPFTIAYAPDGVRAKFTNYLFSNDNDYYAGTGAQGFRVDFDATKFFLAPKVTVVLASDGDNIPNAGNTSSGQNDLFGIRSVMNVLGFNVGLSYVERNILGNGVAPSTGAGRAGYAVDLNGKLGPIGIEAEYNSTKPTDPLVTARDDAFYIKGTIDLGIISVTGNFRGIDPDYAGTGGNGSSNLNNAGISRDFATNSWNKQPYGANQRGFGVDATIKLGSITLTGGLDDFTNHAGAANTGESKVYATLGLPLFLGFTVNTAYFYRITDKATGGLKNTGDNKIGVRLEHDGKTNPLISNLRLAFEYRMFENGAAGDYDASVIQIDGDLTSLKLGPIEIRPGFHFGIGGGSAAGTATKFGVEVATDALNLGFIKPQLLGSFVTRSSSIGSARGETFMNVGLGFVDFLATGGALKAMYSSYAGTGLAAGAGAVGVENHVYDYTTSYIYSDAAGAPANSFTLNGLLVSYTYAGMGIEYSAFALAGTGVTGGQSVGNGFRIFYSLNF